MVAGGWNTAENWNPETIPVSDSNTTLAFGGATAYTATDDIAGDFTLNRLWLQSTATGASILNASSGQILNFANVGLTPASIRQDGTGDFQIALALASATPLHFDGTGTGVTRFTGAIGGSGGLVFDDGYWQLSNTGSTFSGGVTVNTGATLELLAATGPVSVNHTGAVTQSILGVSTGNPLNINGGTMKITTIGSVNAGGTGGHILLGNAFPLSFGADGGVFDLTNSNPSAPNAQAGTIGYHNGSAVVPGGDLALTLNNTAATAVIRFNGGQLGLSSLTAPQSGDWNTAGNNLRIQSYAGSGALRIELTNGAMARAGTGSNQKPLNLNAPTTYRGVLGGDSTSGGAGTTNPATSLTTGRIYVDRSDLEYNGTLTLQDALQILSVSGASRLTGDITLSGIASGHPAMVAFSGRTTGNFLSSTILNPQAGGVGQQPVWLGTAGGSGLTIEEGAIAIFDARIRVDLQNHSGVLLDGNAVLLAGGTLRVAQSVSSFTPASSLANVGDIILRGAVEGRGNSTTDAVLDLRLPVPDFSGTIANGTPSPLTSTPISTTGVRPFGGLDAESEHKIIINGTGFGGLRVEGRARPDALFSVTGLPGGAPKPDPVSNLAKVDGYLTVARLSEITGTEGYLTVAPIGQTWSFPVGGEWSDAVTVGARVTNHNPSGTDVSFAQLPGFSHNIAVDAGATLDFGSAPFDFGPAVTVGGLGTLHGKGTVLAAGGLTIAAGGRVAPGMGDIGSLAIENVTFDGALEIETNASAADLLSVAGNLILGATSQLSVPGTSVLTARNYKIAVAGSLSGTFGSTSGLPGSHTLSYTRPGEIWLSYSAATQRTWTGSASTAWNTSAANWTGASVFANADKVTFDDTAAPANRNVTVLGGNVEPTSITVTTEGSYSLTSSVGAAIIGTGELVKTGTGTLTLSGPATFEGGVLVQQGILATASANSIPDIGKVFISPGAQLNLGGAETINELIVGGSVTSSSLLKVGTLTLEDATNFQAPLELQNRLLKSGAPLTLSQPVDLSGGARTVQVASSTAPELTFGGAVSNGALIKTGAGTLVLGVTNTYAGGTNVQEGVLRAMAAGAVPMNRDVAVASAGTLDLNGFAYTFGALATNGTVTTGGASLTVSHLSGTGGTLSLGAANLQVNQSAAGRYDGAISTTGTLFKAGSGTLTLGGSNTIGGGLQISSGVARIAASGGGGSTNITVLPGATLVADSTISAPITLSGGTFGSRFTIQQVGANADVMATAGTTSTALLADPESLATRSDLILDGTLRGSGNILIQAGTNPISADNGSGFRLHSTTASDFSGIITAGPSTKFELQSVVSGAFSVMGTGKIVMTAGTALGGRLGTYSQLNLRNNSTGDMILGNDVEITGAGLVNFGPTSTGEVAPENSRIVLGNLKIGNDQIAAVNKNASNSQAVQFNSVTLTGGDATFSPNTVGFGFNGTSDLVLGSIGETVANSGIIMEGGANLVLLGNNTYSGSTKLTRGTTWLAGANALPAMTRLEVTGASVFLQDRAGTSFSQTVSALSGGSGGVIGNQASDAIRTLTVNQTIDTIYEGAIEGNLSLVKQGPGMLQLTGVNTYAGTTTVAAGTLAVGSGLIPGSITGAVTVQNGAKLKGNGSVGTLMLEAGGRVDVGDSIGILATESFTLQAGTTLAFELNGTGAGTQYDRLDVFGTLALNGAITFDLQLGFQPGPMDSFTLILNDGIDPLTGGGRFVYQGNTLEQGEIFSVSSNGYLGLFEMKYDANDGNDVMLAAVPEPSVAMLVLGGLCVVGRRRRVGKR